MRITQGTQGKRLALYAALATYIEKLFLEKYKTHYLSKGWWQSTLIVYAKLLVAILLLFTIYLTLRANPKYDSTVLKILFTLPVTYIAFTILIGKNRFGQTYKSKALSDAPFYLRAYFLHSAVELAYLTRFNSLLTLSDLDLNEKRVKKGKRRLLCKAARAPFWPIAGKKPWEVRMPKPTLWQRIKNAFYKFVDMHTPLPLRWSEEEVLNDYRHLSAQDKIYLMSSLRYVIAIFNTGYFEIPRRRIFSMDTTEFTEERYGDHVLRRLYGPFGKGVLSISDYFSLFPSIEHAYAAFYHVLQRTWEKMPIHDICAGYSVAMAFLILTEGNCHSEEATI
jgi:hypothetical protein